MPSAKNRIGGAKAKAYGQLFENRIKNHFLRTGFHIEQIPSGCKWIRPRPIPVKTPFDFIAAKRGKVVIFDAKTRDSESISYSELEQHQVLALLRFHQMGIKAGYLVWFRPVDTIVFYSADILKNLYPRCSLKVSDGVFIGSKNTINLEVLLDEQEAHDRTITPEL